jgi:hypothetical protein
VVIQLTGSSVIHPNKWWLNPVSLQLRDQLLVLKRLSPGDQVVKPTELYLNLHFGTPHSTRYDQRLECFRLKVLVQGSNRTESRARIPHTAPLAVGSGNNITILTLPSACHPSFHPSMPAHRGGAAASGPSPSPPARSGDSYHYSFCRSWGRGSVCGEECRARFGSTAFGSERCWLGYL